MTSLEARSEDEPMSRRRLKSGLLSNETEIQRWSRFLKISISWGWKLHFKMSPLQQTGPRRINSRRANNPLYSSLSEFLPVYSRPIDRDCGHVRFQFWGKLIGLYKARDEEGNEVAANGIFRIHEFTSRAHRFPFEKHFEISSVELNVFDVP